MTGDILHLMTDRSTSFIFLVGKLKVLLKRKKIIFSLLFVVFGWDGLF